jgi:hypothetical protein
VDWLSATQRQRLEEWQKGFHRQQFFSCKGFLAYLVAEHRPADANFFASAAGWNVTVEKNVEAIQAQPLVPRMVALVPHGNHVALQAHTHTDTFLSQWGNGGEVVLSDLRAMQRFYETDEALRVITSLVPAA